ncbi:hypothetical protein AB0939_06940 [Streptomyces sp. NPDC006990]|uniref:hypothetical protein n=1 Tax=Streptomyces sp. NPDC006990 TaxID=3154481 RepID=UPI0034547553
MAKRTTATLIRNRSAAADRMLQRAQQWELMGEDSLPHGLEVLVRLRAALDEVTTTDKVLRERFEAGTERGRQSMPPGEIASFRRRIFTDLRKGRRTLTDLAVPDIAATAEDTALLETTHAFALICARFGHRRGFEGFEAQRLNVGVSWKDVLPDLPALHAFLDRQPRDPEVEAGETAVAVDAAMAKLAADKDALRGHLMNPSPR